MRARSRSPCHARLTTIIALMVLILTSRATAQVAHQPICTGDPCGTMGMIDNSGSIVPGRLNLNIRVTLVFKQLLYTTST